MRAIPVLRVLVVGLLVSCGSSQKPFTQMTAQEHEAAAARENQLADNAFAKIHGDNIESPETYVDEGWAGALSYGYELGDPESYVAWPRVSDPDEKYEDRASKHRENALRHERAAAALEGRPSPQPLPPPQPPLLPVET
jgi:hypothetical protein